MNHIYKVVWSKVRGCYVVVAEIARSNGKTRSQKVVAVLGTALISSMLFTGGGLLTVEAASGQTFGDSTTASGANSIAAGDSTTASGSESIALGTHNTASGSASIAFGGTYLQQTVRKHAQNCSVYKIGDNTYYKYENNYYSTADDTQFTGDTSSATAVMVNGGNTASGTDSVAFGEGTKAIAKGAVAFGLNTQAGSNTGGQNSIAFGNYTQALGGRSVAFGEYTIANYNDSVAFGNDTRALSTGATAFGNRTRALAQYSTAWGNATVAADEESTAWGTDTIAGAKLDDNGAVTNIYTYKDNPDDKNEQAKTATEKMDVHGNLAYIQNGSTVGIKQMDIGGNTEKHDYVVLAGQDGNTYVRDYQGSLWRVKVSADGKTATVDTTVGTNGKVYNNSAKAGAIGSLAKTTVDGKEVDITPESVLEKAHEGTNGYNIDGYKDATAFGYSTEASGDYATAFGNDTKAKAAAATAFGTTTTASGDNATAFGLSTTASGKQATAFGSSATASGDNATAFGESSIASGEAATAFGISSTASGKNSLAGLGGTASTENAIAVGKATEATNTNTLAVGNNAKATGEQSVAIGFGIQENDANGNPYSVTQTEASGESAIAIGTDTKATHQHSLAIGSHTDATADSTVAIGYDTHAASASSIAIGSGSKANSGYTIAIGLSALAGPDTATTTIEGSKSLAVGYFAQATKENNIALGYYAQAVNAKNATAVGTSANAETEGSVALGYGSDATRASGNIENGVSKDAYLKPTTVSTDKASVWISTAGAVSVGKTDATNPSKNITRQITNVAAGSDDTDAVNVAQLKAAQPTVTSNDHSVTITPSTDSTDYHKIYDLKIATATLLQEKTGSGDSAVATGKVSVNNPTYPENGQNVENTNAYVTGKSVADAINNSGFNLIASKSEGDVTGNAKTLIHPGDTVTIDAGKNISLTQDKGKISIALKKDINLEQTGSLTVGGDKQDDSTTGQDPIIIKHFDAGDLTVTGKDKDGNTLQSKAGDYVTGLDNKDWDVTNPTYVSGRAATEDQLKAISDEIKKTATTASQHTEITVNDKNNPTTVSNVGTDTYGDYAGTGNGNLSIAAKKDTQSGKTIYNIKLNDQLAIGKKGTDGKDGKDGTDGKVTVETSKGTTVVIGHDGEPGKDGKDGISVKGQDGKDGVILTAVNGKDGTEGHIGLAGPKGADGKDGAFTDLSTILGTSTLDREKNEVRDKDDSTKDKASRIQYQTTITAEDGSQKTITHEVATMDDGLKFVGNDGKEVTKKLNSTLSLTGGITNADALKNASTKNLGVRSNEKGDGLEIVMSETPDFTRVTVGGDTKITIGGQPNTDTKNPANGNYITGLDNTKWDKDHVTENRAATEGQLRDIAGSITNQANGGGFALTSDEKGDDKVVKQDLGKAIQIKGDTTYKTDGSVEKAGNIKTSVDNGAIKVELNKDVDLGGNGSLNAGQTKVDQNGVDTNKVTIKDSTISISKEGINGGDKQITNVASGASEIIKGADGKDVYKYDNDANAANIGDVKRIAGEMKNNIANVTNNVTDVTNKVTKMGDQIHQVNESVNNLNKKVEANRDYQGDDGAAKKVNVKFGSFLSLTGGAKADALTAEGNIGVVQKEVDDPANAGQKMMGLSVRLAKHLNLEKTTYESEMDGQKSHADIDGNGLTINHVDASGKENNVVVRGDKVSAGGNKVENVAPGKVAPDSTDAVNGSQLAQRDQAIGKLGGEVSSLDRRVDRVGAGAAALAALHPQDFDPDDKWDFAVGYGNYRGANAAAVGAFYRPNEDTTLSIGGTVGGGENMVNAGISFKFGQGNHVSNSRVAMAKEILALKDYVQKQDEKIEKLEALVGQQGTAAAPKHRSILFPDVPENHWAYAYVKKLADRGLLEGYPDGEFKGDRTITRYEFAAIFSRALENGASVDGDMERMSEEFEPEIRELSLSRFRVDRVEGKDNDRHKIERVRVNDRDELVQQKNGEQKKRYRDVYGSVIEKDAPADAAK